MKVNVNMYKPCDTSIAACDCSFHIPTVRPFFLLPICCFERVVDLANVKVICSTVRQSFSD